MHTPALDLLVSNASKLGAFPTSLPPYVGAVIFEAFLYGLYTVLFAICTYVLLSRSRRSARSAHLHWLLLAAAATMFALATSDMAITLRLLFVRLLGGVSTSLSSSGLLSEDGILSTDTSVVDSSISSRSTWQGAGAGSALDALADLDLRPKYWLYVTNNVLADALLLYRCWVVWEYSTRVVLLPALLLIAGTCSGYALQTSSASAHFDKGWIYLTMTLLLNIILTALTACRIWWLAGRAKPVLSTGLFKRYNATITILVESGIIYSLYIILVLALRRQPVARLLLDGGLIQVVGIMPTLIIVQVGLGRAVHDIEANEALTRLEGNKLASRPSDVTRVRSRKSQQQSSDTVMSRARHIADRTSHDIVDVEHEIGIEGLQRLRGGSLQLSWEFGISTSPPQELGILQPATAAKTV